MVLGDFCLGDPATTASTRRRRAPVIPKPPECNLRKITAGGHQLEAELWILVDELGERPQLVAAVMELVEVEERAWTESVLDVLDQTDVEL